MDRVPDGGSDSNTKIEYHVRGRIPRAFGYPFHVHPAGITADAARDHRFGFALKEHLHFHCCVIDGVFEPAPGCDMAVRLPYFADI